MIIGKRSVDIGSPVSTMLALVTANGDCLWTHTIDTLSTFTPVSIFLNDEQQPAIVGFRTNRDSVYESDIAVCTLTDSGAIADFCVMNGLHFLDVSSSISTTDGYVVCGEGIDQADSRTNLTVIKLDTLNGMSLEWSASLRPISESVTSGRWIIPVSQGGYAIVGTVRPDTYPSSPSRVYVVRLDERGDTLWTKMFGDSTFYFEGESIVETQDHGFIILAERSQHYGILSVIRAIRIDADGEPIWQRDYSTGSYLILNAQSIIHSSRQGWLIGGFSDQIPPHDYQDYYIQKVNDNGDSLWSMVIPSGGLGHISCLLPLRTGGDLFVGTVFGSSDFTNDLVVGRFDEVESVSPTVLTPTCDDLLQTYPNPFNSATTIHYALPMAGKIRLSIYDLLGRESATLYSGPQTAGSHEIRFDGSALSSGIYFVRLRAGRTETEQKIILLK